MFIKIIRSESSTPSPFEKKFTREDETEQSSSDSESGRLEDFTFDSRKEFHVPTLNISPVNIYWMKERLNNYFIT